MNLAQTSTVLPENPRSNTSLVSDAPYCSLPLNGPAKGWAPVPSGNLRLWGFKVPRVSGSLRLKLEILALGLVIGAATWLFLRPELVDFGKWGYLSAFLINGVSTATVLLPAPGIAAIIATGNDLNPFLLGLVTGIGGTLGSLTAYWAGVQGRRVIRASRYHNVMVQLMSRFGGAVLFFFSAAAFMPADFASILAGATRYPMRRYLIYVGAGNIFKMIVLLYLAHRYYWVLESLFDSF